MINIKLEKYLLIMSITFLSLFISFSTVSADNGPKPELKIIVENPPDHEYYLDLLVDYEVNYGYTWLHEEDYDQEKIKIFKDFRDGNWRPALLTKTRAPIAGKLIGIREGDKVIHEFGYTLPDKFKIAILDGDNKITVSDEITLEAFKTTITYDYKNNSINNENRISSFKDIMKTCIVTLIIEGIVLLLFRFSIKKNIKPFILINVLTQVLLYVVLNLVVYKYNVTSFIPTFITMEGIILIIESILFSKHLKEHTIKRRIAFSVVANILSCLSGFVIYVFIYRI